MDEERNFNYSFTATNSSFMKAARQVVQQIEDLGASISSYGQSIRDNAVASENLDKMISKTGKTAKSTSKQVNTLSSALRVLRKVMGTYASVAIGRYLAEAITSSIDFIETINLLRVSLGEATTEARRFGNVMSEALGIDTAEIYRSVGLFNQLSESMGVPAEQAKLIGTEFTKLSNDLASLFNTTVADASEDLQSALVGISKPIRQYGIDVSENALQSTAWALGIDQDVASMSRANKIGLTYITIMEQSRAAQGDFARTIEEPANQLRVLSNQFAMLSRNIGNLFLPAISAILPVVNGVVMALNALISTLATLLGFTMPDFSPVMGGNASSIGAVGDAAEETANKLKKMVAPFDELNIISEDTSSAGAGAGASWGMDPAIIEAMKSYDNLMGSIQMKATQIRDRIMETLGFTKQINEETGEITWTWSFTDMVKGLAKASSDLINWWIGLDLGGKLAAILVAAFVAHIIKSLGSKVITAFSKVMGTIISGIGTLISGIGSAFNTLISAINPVTVAIGLVVAAILYLWTTSEEFRTYVSEQLAVLAENIGILVERLIEIVGGLVNYVLTSIKQLLNWLKTSNDTTATALRTIWEAFATAVGFVVQGILQVLNGVISFLIGVFTGEWQRVWQGVYDIFAGVWNAIIGIVESACNLIIDAINWVIRQLNKIHVDVPDWVTDLTGMTGFGFNIPLMEHVKLERLADGGMLGRGQFFEAGENGKAELIGGYQGKTTVMPLENSGFTEAMGQAVYDGVYNALSMIQGNNQTPTQVEVIIGGKNFDTIVYDAYNRAKRNRGAQILGGALGG